jgi:alpha-aminoadipate carrier protein LysW
MAVSCPECNAEMKVPSDAIDGEIVSCPDCGSALELVFASDGTIQLQPAEVIGEDWGE